MLARLEYAQDLHAADTVYHQQCSSNFRTGKQIPQPYDSEFLSDPKKKKHQGWPYDLKRTEAFLQLANYLEENDVEQISISDLNENMKEYLGDSNSERNENVNHYY